MSFGVRYDNSITVSAKDVPVGAKAPIFTEPYATVTVYTDGTLTELAPCWRDQALTEGGPNPMMSDAEGRFGFWINQGNYVYTVTSATGVLLGTYNLTLTAGSVGPGATVNVGTVTTGAPGSPAMVTNSGSATAAVLGFSIPTGATGSAATIAVGTVATGAPGSPAAVTNAGSSGAAVLNFSLPTGATGPQGAPGIASLPQLASIRTTGPTTNIYDPSIAQLGFYGSATGTAAGGGTSLSLFTGLIPANTGGFMTVNANLMSGVGGDGGASFYDVTGAFIETIASTGISIPVLANTPIPIPATAAYVRFSPRAMAPAPLTAALLSAALMIVNGSTIPSIYVGFQPANAAAISASLSTINMALAALNSAEADSVSITRNPNLVGPQIFNLNGYYNGSGTFVPEPTISAYQYSNLIPLLPNTTYTIGFPVVPSIPVAKPFTIPAYGGATYILYDSSQTLITAGVPGANPGAGITQLPAGGLPNPYTFTTPANTAYIRFSGNHLTDIAGAVWNSGDWWTPDSIPLGSNGIFGSHVMMIRGSSLPGYYLPYGKAALDYDPRYLGTPIGIWGDSIASLFGVGWEQVLWEMGFLKQVQDARSGRDFPHAFEGFQTITPGATPSTYDAGVALGLQVNCAQGGYAQSGQTSSVNWGGEALGQTLAQVLAPVRLMIIALGTNDINFPLGALGDATDAGTQYGNMRWVIEAIMTANPTMQILLVTCMARYDGLNFASTATLALSQATAAATVAIGKSYNIPVLDMYHDSGVNAFTASSKTQDGIHPALGDAGMHGYYGGAIKGFIKRYF